QQRETGAVLHHDLAAQQVQAVYAMCSLMDGVEPIVAVPLLDIELGGVAVTAVHLDGQVVGLQAPLRRPALGDGGQHLQEKLGPPALGVAGSALFIDQAGAVEAERECAFDIGLLGQQHPLDIGAT
ncbi:MAG: hypothetical protein K0R33_4616, partial [Mycobacterium sp.]|nr:hypothetical protein [Mycobacterium sp.]